MIPPSLSESIIENLAEGLIYFDSSTIIAAYNQMAEKITGMPSSFAVGRSFADVFSRDCWLVDMLRKTLEEGKVIAECEGTISQRFGSPLPVVVTASPVFGTDGRQKGVVATMRDLSGIRPLELDSLRKERLAFIGVFAASIAHEIKNPLGGMRGVAQLLSRKVSGGELREYSDIIIKEVDRLNKLIEEILDFSKPKELKLRSLNIHKILDNVLVLVARPRGVSISLEYDPSLPHIRGDGEQLTQVFMNFIKNAIEAIEGSGEVRILTRMVTDFHLVEEGLKGIKMVSVEVRDDGRGIRPENLEKVFTPFFTTKPTGTGLGMAIAYKVIKDHGGLFGIESSPGAGTKVVVYLPVAEEVVKDNGE